jgi:CheY-like chemotaxis protein
VAHDFANLIQAVRGNAELLLLERAPQGAGRTEIEEILRVTDRASELTSQLLTVSRRIDGKPRTIDANAEAAKAQRLLARVLPKTVAIDLRLAPGTLMVEADPLQIGQVLMNLAVNARDAMPEGGRLRIATNKTTLDEARCRTRPGLQPGKYVRLAVADTGCGMPAEAMEHIFEPFFTTKPAGRGTGLGLSIVYGIVKKHRGYIECTSEVGTGTEFRIYLPRVKAVAAAPAPERKEQAVRGGAETVLLVEDEDSVRAIAQRMLQRAGYTVLSAPNGEAALSLFEVRRDRIGLVVLDLQMPGMGGRRCLERLRELSPDLRVIITTGAAPDPATESALQQDAQSVITKPYSLHTLLATVRSVLDARANGGAEREEAR